VTACINQQSQNDHREPTKATQIMKTPTTLKSVLALTATLGLATVASAAVIGPWPTNSSIMWETQPIPSYNSGPVTISDLPAPYGVLNMTTPTGSPKNASWLPIPGYGGDRLALAQLVLAPNMQLDTIHAKVYDPSTGTGANGFALTLWDNTGKILDFGIRPDLAANNIRTYQYNGASWVNVTAWGRTRTGNNYFTYDISQNPDGTLAWTFGYNQNNVTIGSVSGTTSVAYGAITNLYLNTGMVTTSGPVNYKWTEFSYTASVIPEPSTAVTLAGGLLGLAYLARRKRL
jgi:hypothetical protein